MEKWDSSSSRNEWMRERSGAADEEMVFIRLLNGLDLISTKRDAC